MPLNPKVRIGPRDAISEAHTKVSLETLVEERVRQRTAAGARGTAALREAARAEVLSNADIVACTLVGSGVDSLLALRDSSSSSNRYKLGVSSLHLDLYYMSRYRVRSYM